ncbi:hypothetical protein NM688_g8604 [Phlebia brevispora]|uniref:Uncharacterized protein n=1 Tax=Phlebia brevispora TaxID=194682 RepID=A0ACC1RTB1_9APHY|nr:hypothetical protein NM688_g8604 [Phlebia brevispora]
MSDRSSSAVGVSRSLCTPQGPAYEVPIQLFLQYVLPPLPRGLEVAQIISELTSIGKKSSLQKPITLKGRWRGFPVDPSSSKDPDRMSFRNLPSVFHSILKAGSTKANRLRACLQFQNNAACAPRPLDKSICTLPDAFWFRGTQCSWSTIAVSGELRKGQSSADEMDNVTKITSSMSNCMRTDPRRRFTFGFTIENTNMKLWFCDRSQILFTTPFNFISDREYLVHFCLAVAYAHPNQLGWDPTMVPTNQHGQYDITVYTDDGLTRVYRTLQLISDSGAQTIRGRGTRVWKVVRVEDGEEHGEPMVLKDTWVDTNRRREGTTLDEIRNAERIPDHQVFVDRIFLTREWDGDVFQDAARTIIDSTPDFTPSPDDLPQSPRMSTPSASGSTSVEQRAVVPKVHYRIVFKEVCKPVHSETSLRKIFVALAQTAAGLQLMHQAGWVHRDISTGNILLGEDGTARLMDLEYTRKAGTGDESLLVMTSPSLRWMRAD